jgi:hypothetical protein
VGHVVAVESSDPFEGQTDFTYSIVQVIEIAALPELLCTLMKRTAGSEARLSSYAALVPVHLAVLKLGTGSHP